MLQLYRTLVRPLLEYCAVLVATLLGGCDCTVVAAEEIHLGTKCGKWVLYRQID